MTRPLALLVGVPEPLHAGLRSGLSARGLEPVVAGEQGCPTEPSALAAWLDSRAPVLACLVNGRATWLGLPGQGERPVPPYPLYEAALRHLAPDGGCMVTLFDHEGLNMPLVQGLMGRLAERAGERRLCHNAMALHGPETGAALTERVETLVWLCTLEHCSPQGEFLRGWSGQPV